MKPVAESSLVRDRIHRRGLNVAKQKRIRLWMAGTRFPQVKEEERATPVPGDTEGIGYPASIACAATTCFVGHGLRTASWSN